MFPKKDIEPIRPTEKKEIPSSNDLSSRRLGIEAVIQPLSILIIIVINKKKEKIK